MLIYIISVLNFNKIIDYYVFVSYAHNHCSWNTNKMCILFIIVGDATHPTIIGNNRDEYLKRPTERGQYFKSMDQYHPVDIEGGG